MPPRRKRSLSRGRRRKRSKSRSRKVSVKNDLSQKDKEHGESEANAKNIDNTDDKSEGPKESNGAEEFPSQKQENSFNGIDTTMRNQREDTMGDLRRKSESNEKPTTKSGKLPVAEQATFSKFFLVLIMHMCKKILIINTTRLVWFYICAVTVISLFTDLFPFPKSYFSSKNHIWNQYFVKLGWGWTLVALTPFMCLTNYVLSCGKRELAQRHLMRLAVATGSWFIVTSVMSIIENRYGSCNSEVGTFYDKSSCTANNGTWTKYFDISGHAFILVHCILTITEEAAIFRDWSKLNELIRKEDKSLVNVLSVSNFEKLKDLYVQYTPLVQCSVVFLSMIQFLWNVMLLSTTVYFHIMPDKFVGVVLAVLTWFLSYRVFYKSNQLIPGPIDLSNAPFKQIKLA